jgi:hypothetical protein
MNKKQGQKPELVVLVRGKPGEAVLMNCKGARNSGVLGGNQDAFNGCLMTYCSNWCWTGVAS